MPSLEQAATWDKLIFPHLRTDLIEALIDLRSQHYNTYLAYARETGLQQTGLYRLNNIYRPDNDSINQLFVSLHEGLDAVFDGVVDRR